MAEKKRSLEEFLSFAPPKRTEYVSAEPINVEGELKEKPKAKGVKQAQMERKVAPTPAQSPQSSAPVKPQAKASVREVLAPEAPTPAAAPVKVGGEYVPPTPPQSQSTPVIPQTTEGPTAWERAMIGATPLLVGWLSGNTLEGTQTASKYLTDSESDLYKRERDFNQKLSELQAQKALKAAPNGKATNVKTIEYLDSKKQARTGRIINGEYYLDENTDPLVHVKATKDSWITKTLQTENGPKEVAYNPATGETREIGDHYERPRTALTDLDLGGEKTKTLVDMESGKKTFIGQGWEKPSNASLANQGKDERQIRQIRVGLLKDITKPTSVYSQRRESLEGMARAATLLNEGGPIGASGLRMILARSVFGEKGPLSDGDVSRLSGDPSMQETVSRVWDKYLTGQPLTENDRADVRAVIEVAADLAREDADRYLDDYLNTYKAEGYDLTPQLSQFRSMPEIPAFRSGKGKGISQAQFEKKVPLPAAGEVRNGYRFKGGDPKDKKNWEKQ